MEYQKKIGMLAIGTLLFGQVATAGTLQDVQARGELICGINGGVPGFSAPDDTGKMQGIDADSCYRIAAVVLGDSTKVKFVPLTAKERFVALSSGEVDVLARNTTHTLTRDATLGLNFTYYNFIDGQGFMVKKSTGINSAKELDGARICVQSGTTTELNMADYFRQFGMKFTPKGYDTAPQTREGFSSGACDALTADKSQLAALRTELKNPSEAMILPQTISKEPLGPVVRQGDDEWFNVVKWVLFASINAEELGVNSANIDKMKSTNNPSIKRLLGTEGRLCAGLASALPNDCFYQAIKQVGNFGESYEKHVGKNTAIGLTRMGSVNDLWTRGGVIYAPPIR